MSKRVLFLTVILITTFVHETYGQISYKTILPLKTKIESVQKLFGKGNKISSNKLAYENQEEEIIVSYYQSGCETSVENKLGISNGVIFEIKVHPKKVQNAVQLLKSLYDPIFPRDLVSKNLDENSLIHFDLKEGVVISGKKMSNEEVVESYYFIPGNNIPLPKCLIEQIDTELKFIFEDNSLCSEKCQPPHDGKVATLYVEEGESSYMFEQLDYLIQNLRDCPNFTGNLTYYSRKGVDSSKISKYIEKLKNYVTKNKNIPPERIIFENGGVSEFSYVDIYITSKIKE